MSTDSTQSTLRTTDTITVNKTSFSPEYKEKFRTKFPTLAEAIEMDIHPAEILSPTELLELEDGETIEIEYLEEEGDNILTVDDKFKLASKHYEQTRKSIDNIKTEFKRRQGDSTFLTELILDDDLNNAFDISDSLMDFPGIQKRRTPHALQVHVTAVVISCEDKIKTDFTQVMKSCDVIDFTLDALTTETPRTKAFMMTMHNVATDTLRHVDPLKRLLETGTKHYRIRAIPRYLNRNMQWKKLLTTDIFEPATQYDQAMNPFIKMHLSYKIDSITNNEEETKTIKTVEKAPETFEVQEYQKKTLDSLLKLTPSLFTI